MSPLSNSRPSKNVPVIQHPLAIFLYFISFLLAALFFSHPFYLGVLVLSTAFQYWMFGKGKDWLRSLRMAMWLSGIFVGVNILVGHAGETILWQGPRLERFGITFDLSLEELVYNLAMSLRIVLLVSIFGLYFSVQNPDDALSYFSRFAPHSTLTVILTALRVPEMKARFEEARHILAARGVPLNTGSPWRRIQFQFPLLKIALLGSLEDSWAGAESLYARAYGVGPRSQAQTFSWQAADRLALAAAASFLVLIGISIWWDKGQLIFYPRIAPVLDSVSFDIFVPLTMSALMVPAVQLVTGKNSGRNRGTV